MKVKIITAFILLISFFEVGAQNVEIWEKSIRKFEELDRINYPEEGVILFLESSSITMWENISDYFPSVKLTLL